MVIDASAAVAALAKDGPARILRVRLAAMTCHAPHLFDAEVGSALRGQERAGRFSSADALAGLRTAHDLIDHRYSNTGPLALEAWALRHNLSFYDALYVALAERLNVPLLTADARLPRAP